MIHLEFTTRNEYIRMNIQILFRILNYYLFKWIFRNTGQHRALFAVLCYHLPKILPYDETWKVISSMMYTLTQTGNDKADHSRKSFNKLRMDKFIHFWRDGVYHIHRTKPFYLSLKEIWKVFVCYTMCSVRAETHY